MTATFTTTLPVRRCDYFVGLSMVCFIFLFVGISTSEEKNILDVSEVSPHFSGFSMPYLNFA
jgi:hypothetical protein